MNVWPALIPAALIMVVVLFVAGFFHKPPRPLETFGVELPAQYLSARNLLLNQDAEFATVTTAFERRLREDHGDDAPLSEAEIVERSRIGYVQTVASNLFAAPGENPYTRIHSEGRTPYYSGEITGVMDQQTSDAIASACAYLLADLNRNERVRRAAGWLPRLRPCAPEDPEALRDVDSVQAALLVRYAELTQFPYRRRLLVGGGGTTN